MATLTPTQIAQVARQGGFPEADIPTAVAIALAESSGRTNAHNDNRLTGDNSYGLWQINMIDKYGPERRKRFNLTANEQLYDPVTNARVAHQMRVSRGNWRDWSTYNRGEHLIYMGQAKQATTGAKKAGWEPFKDWNDPFDLWNEDAWGPAPKSPWESLTGETPPESFGSDSGLWSIGTLLTGFSEAITNPDNWRNWAYVAMGGALVIGGLVIVTKPYAQTVANAAPTGRVLNAVKPKRSAPKEEQ